MNGPNVDNDTHFWTVSPGRHLCLHLVVNMKGGRQFHEEKESLRENFKPVTSAPGLAAKVRVLVVLWVLESSKNCQGGVQTQFDGHLTSSLYHNDVLTIITTKSRAFLQQKVSPDLKHFPSDT